MQLAKGHTPKLHVIMTCADQVENLEAYRFIGGYGQNDKLFEGPDVIDQLSTHLSAYLNAPVHVINGLKG